jgi:hypothetical protein
MIAVNFLPGLLILREIQCTDFLLYTEKQDTSLQVASNHVKDPEKELKLTPVKLAFNYRLYPIFKQAPNARGYNWVTLFLGDINTGT